MKEEIEASKVVAQTELVAFRRSSIHGVGGYARLAITRGTRIIEYVGEVIDKVESLRRCQNENVYIFTLDSEHDLDGSVEWNLARFINHSCASNCEAELMDGHIWFIATRDIAAGEELSINYGYDLSEYKEYPCRCGARECVGYIVAEEFHPHVRQQRQLSSADHENPRSGDMPNRQ